MSTSSSTGHEVTISESAMLGFLGHGHPHSAAWFMELLMTFEDATGVRAKADPEQATRLTYVEAQEKLAGAFAARRDLLKLVAEHLDEFPEEYQDELRQILAQLKEALDEFTFDPDLATTPTEAMLDRAARAHYEMRYPKHTFDAQDELVKEACRDAVRPVLAAALGGGRSTPPEGTITYEEARKKIADPLHTLASTIGRLRVAVDSEDPGVERDLTEAAAAVGDLRNTFTVAD